MEPVIYPIQRPIALQDELRANLGLIPFVQLGVINTIQPVIVTNFPETALQVTPQPGATWRVQPAPQYYADPVFSNVMQIAPHVFPASTGTTVVQNLSSPIAITMNNRYAIRFHISIAKTAGDMDSENYVQPVLKLTDPDDHTYYSVMEGLFLTPSEIDNVWLVDMQEIIAGPSMLTVNAQLPLSLTSFGMTFHNHDTSTITIGYAVSCTIWTVNPSLSS